MLWSGDDLPTCLSLTRAPSAQSRRTSRFDPDEGWLSEAVRSFDFVLLDTPPIMSVTDSLILAPMTDGVIIVTKGGKNPPDILNRVKKNLKMVRARIIGVLCNNVDLSHSDYHHYLKQYYEYSSYVGEAPPAKHSAHD